MTSVSAKAAHKIQNSLQRILSYIELEQYNRAKTEIAYLSHLIASMVPPPEDEGDKKE